MPRLVVYLAAAALLLVSGLRLKGFRWWTDWELRSCLAMWLGMHVAALWMYPREAPSWAVIAVCAMALMILLSERVSKEVAWRTFGLLGAVVYATLVLVAQMLLDCGAEFNLGGGLGVPLLACVMYALWCAVAGLVRRRAQ